MDDRIAEAASIYQTQTAVISYEQFLNSYHGSHAEWVDGKVHPMSPVSWGHQRIVGLLVSVLRQYVAHLDLGEILFEPFQMKTGPNLPGREPDVLFVATEHLDRITETYLKGPADLVIEVVSPESVDRDRVTKFREYEQGGVPEYWIVDPMRKAVACYVLSADGKYRQEAPNPDGAYSSVSVRGFLLNPAWLWQTPMPKDWDILRELGVL